MVFFLLERKGSKIKSYQKLWKHPLFFLVVTNKNALERAAKLQGIAQSKNKKDLQDTGGQTHKVYEM